MILTKFYNYIFIDIDGVIRDLMKKMIEVLHREYGMLPVRKDVYDISKWYPSIQPKEKFYDLVFKKHVKEIFGYAPQYPGALDRLGDFVSLLHGNDGKAFFVSKQKEERIELTNQWLQNWNIDTILIQPIYVDEDKSKIKSVYDSKNHAINFIRLFGSNGADPKVLFIDDSVDELEKVSKIKNIDCVCVNQPWNQNWDGYRVKSFSDIYFSSIVNDKIKVKIKLMNK